MEKKNQVCESCFMPFHKDPGTRESEQYCSLCYGDGKLRYEGSDFKEFQRICHKGMVSRGINPLVAHFYTFLMRFAPRWKNQK